MGWNESNPDKMMELDGPGRQGEDRQEGTRNNMQGG